MWFWIFDLIIFNRDTAHLDIELAYKNLVFDLLVDASSDFLETLQLFMLWYENVHVDLDSSLALLE